MWPIYSFTYQPYSQKLTQFSPNNFFWTTWDSLTFLLVSWVPNTGKMKDNSLCAMLVIFNLLKTKLEEKKNWQIIFAFALKLQISFINYSYICFFFLKKVASETFEDVILQCMYNFQSFLLFLCVCQISSFKLNPSTP